MDLTEIINNIFGISLNPTIAHNLTNETIQDLLKTTEYHKIGLHVTPIHGLFPPYDDFLFNPYFQMIVCILGVWTLQDMFDILIWPYIKLHRDRFYRWLWCLIKRGMRRLRRN